MPSDLSIAPPLRKITDSSDIPKLAVIVAKGFSQDALNRYLFLGRESNPDHPKLQELEPRVKYWEAILQPRFENGAVLVESHDWAAVALWYVSHFRYATEIQISNFNNRFPPGVEKKPNPASTLSEGVTEYLTFYKALREEKLGDRPHWHLNIIARDPARNDKGKAYNSTFICPQLTF